MSRGEIGKRLSTAAAAAVRSTGENVYTKSGSAAEFQKTVKTGHAPWSHTLPSFVPKDSSSAVKKDEVDPRHWEPLGGWSAEEVKESVRDNVMLTWAPSKTKMGMPLITHGEGIYLYDSNGKQYIDWTSQAVCNNLGHTVPESVRSTLLSQLDSTAFVYGGMGMTEVRARLSKLVSEILPAGMSGLAFPSSGSEANEAAIAMCRRFTGKKKVLSAYRSYHGGSANSAAATGDFRRWMQPSTPDFIKVFQPHTLLEKLNGESEAEKVQNSLTMLEEQIVYEGPDQIASIMIESVPGAAGVLTFPDGYMQGVRALCDKYGIMMHCDEIMVGFGRTGKMWGFQHYDGVVPDIVTSAKGLSGAILPVSMVACSSEMQAFFEDHPLGWGSTYQAHPVALACAYASIKHMLEHNIVGGVAEIAPQFKDHMERLAAKHPSIKQYRSVGLFGAFDAKAPNGEQPQWFHHPRMDAFTKYLQAFNSEGLIGLLRPPIIHIAPPLIINEEELAEGFDRHDRALDVLDKELGF